MYNLINRLARDVIQLLACEHEGDWGRVEVLLAQAKKVLMQEAGRKGERAGDIAEI